MSSKFLFIFLPILLFGNSTFSQNDFSIEWNVYEEGMIVDDDPFNGGVTIKNVGDTTIPINDTIWFGYLIEGMPYDISLNVELFSGHVLSDVFEPGDEISIFNSIEWPLWGSGAEIEVCAIVYGVGYESHCGDYFTGDIDISNNISCLTAVLPEYALGIKEISQKNMTIAAVGNKIRIINSYNETIAESILKIYAYTGNELMDEKIELMSGENWIDLNFMAKGVYLVQLHFDSKVIVEKLVY